jgi:tRNA nucleotidyltransferase (CCA-adding enzyme)
MSFVKEYLNHARFKDCMDFTALRNQLRPSQEEKEAVAQATQEIIQLLEGKGREVMAGGSTAKHTNLRGNYDIDIFVRFATPDNLDERLEILVKKLPVQYERVHGSRDYFMFTYKHFSFEIVPVYKVQSANEIHNVTDMSPLHVEWAKKHLTPELQDAIRLAKQFCKAAGVYGAESYINGVSGHVLDILLIYYGSFEKFIAAVASWKEKTIIDPLDKQSNEEIMQTLNVSKTVSPLILIDPIDRQRNAAAALSEEKYVLLVDVAKHFLQAPSEEYFIIKKVTQQQLEELIGEDEQLISITVTAVEGKPDVSYTKILKVKEHLERSLHEHDFIVRHSGWNIPSLIYFILPKQPLSKTRIRKGPPATQEKDVEKFKEANRESKVFEKEKFYYVQEARAFTDAKELLAFLLQDDFVQSRVESSKLKTYPK